DDVIVTHDVLYEQPWSLRAAFTRPWCKMTGPSENCWGKNLERLTTAEVLKCDVARIGNQSIPISRLEDVLKEYGSKPNFTMFVELKHSTLDNARERDTLLGKKVTELLNKYVPPERRWVASFNDTALAAVGPGIQRMRNCLLVDPTTNADGDFIEAV